jgi:cysteinyl-tRNA synthetase
MSHKYLGAAFDIHGGGLDLRFPHHENELAQSSAAGDDFANFWLHNGLVTYEGEKMSKSLGNTVSPRQMLQLAPARVVRYFLGQAHYRSQLDYSEGSLREAGAALERIDRFLSRAASAGLPPVAEHLHRVTDDFAAAMDDDLGVPQALAALHETVRSGNTALDSGDEVAAAEAAARVATMLEVLGLSGSTVPDASAGESTESAALAGLVEARIAERAEARASKDWARSDAIRDELAAVGVVVKDGANGATWTLA